MFQKSLVFLCIVGVALARSASSTVNSVDETQGRSANGIANYMNDIKFLYKTYSDCSKSDVATCLKMKLVSSMHKTFRNLKDVQVAEGIKFVKDETVQVADVPLKSEAEIEQSLPRSLDEKNSVLNGFLLKEFISFFNTHTLQVKLPSAEEYQRSLSEEGRGNKKRGGMIMIPLLLGGTFIPIAYGALALLAGKALIVSKLALVLASIIGIKKLLSHSHGHHDAHEVVVSGHGHSGWGRNYEQPQQMAYSAFAPKL